MNTIELLQELKDILMDRGWCQGTFQDGEGRVCLRGAIGHVYLIASEDYRQLSRVLQDQIGAGITGWNDYPGRTFNEVVDLIDTAILAEKGLEDLDTLNETPGNHV